MNTSLTPADTVLDTLVSEGFDRDDVIAAINSLIESGLTHTSDDDSENVLTADEIEVVRDQLTCYLGASNWTVTLGHTDCPVITLMTPWSAAWTTREVLDLADVKSAVTEVVEALHEGWEPCEADGWFTTEKPADTAATYGQIAAYIDRMSE